MNLTKQDLEAIGNLIDEKLEEKLAPIRTDIYYLKQANEMLVKQMMLIMQDIAGFKLDIAGLKADIAGFKQDIAGIKTDISGLKTDVDILKKAAA